ncbi:MAG: hypothetical protein ACREF3_17905 [Acetobacteraceae bacterium]
MIDQLLEAAGNLAAALEQENAALEKLDLAAAAGCLGRKQHAVAAFATVQAALANTPIDNSASARVIDVGNRLNRLVGENRRLLERGLAVQARVIGVIARAMPRAIAAGAAGYRAGGAPAGARLTLPMTLSARA